MEDNISKSNSNQTIFLIASCTIIINYAFNTSFQNLLLLNNVYNTFYVHTLKIKTLCTLHLNHDLVLNTSG